MLCRGLIHSLGNLLESLCLHSVLHFIALFVFEQQQALQTRLMHPVVTCMLKGSSSVGMFQHLQLACIDRVVSSFSLH